MSLFLCSHDCVADDVEAFTSDFTTALAGWQGKEPVRQNAVSPLAVPTEELRVE
jgi:hypothetical protein